MVTSIRKSGYGYSIIISYIYNFNKILNELKQKEIIDLEENDENSTIEMHSRYKRRI